MARVGDEKGERTFTDWPDLPLSHFLDTLFHERLVTNPFAAAKRFGGMGEVSIRKERVDAETTCHGRLVPGGSSIARQQVALRSPQRSHGFYQGRIGMVGVE